MALIIDWAEDQIRRLGRRDARNLAVALFAGIHCAVVFANSFRDFVPPHPSTRRLERWIDTLACE
jgi:hypothetical protein